MTYQIIYCSKSTTPMQLDDLEDLLEHAQSSNAAKGITGALVYVDGVFLQVLEGDKGSVADLMATIARDLRHDTVTVLREGEIPCAIFGDWNMAYVSATSEQVAQWAGFSGASAIPEILTVIREDPNQAAQMAQGILRLLESEKAVRTGAD